MRIITLALPVLLLASLSSCATIITGTSDEITFNSIPEGAQVYEKGVEKCTTPCTLTVNRSLSEKLMELRKEGFENKYVSLTTEFNGVSLLNVLLGGVVGLGIDAATGSIRKFDTKVYEVSLESKK